MKVVAASLIVLNQFAKHRLKISGFEEKIFLTSLSGIFVKIISGILSFFSLRIILLYLGTEKYGLWVTMTSFIALLGFMDLGFGNQLMNNVAKALGKGKDGVSIIQKQIAIACVSLTVIITGFFILFGASFLFLSWKKILATPEHLLNDAYATFIVIGISFGTTLFLNLVALIERGLQKGYYANVWELGRTLSAFLFLVIITKLDLGMPWVAVGVFVLPLIFLAGNWIWFFKKYKEYFPKNWHVQWNEVKVFFKQGSLFFYLQIAAILAYQIDSLVLAHFMNYNAVSEYSVGMKLFTIPAILTDTYMASLWPAYANAYGRNDVKWIKRTFYKSLFMCGIFLLLSAVILILSSQSILHLWLDDKVQISTLFLIILGTWLFLNAFNINVSCLLNALNIARPQVIIVAIVLILNLLFSILLVQRVGTGGVLLGSVLALVIGGGVPYALLIKKVFHSFKNISS
jgi:O-antigen/teichoic acid export membrane protein